MKRPKFSRFSAAVHFIETLEDWAATRHASVYPGVIPAGAERYPLVTIETNGVTKIDKTKDGGADALEYDMTVTVAVKERGSHSVSGQEMAEELADEIVDALDNTRGEHNGYIVDLCQWQSASPGYDDGRDCYYMEMDFRLSATPPAQVTETAEVGRARADYAVVSQSED